MKTLDRVEISNRQKMFSILLKRVSLSVLTKLSLVSSRGLKKIFRTKLSRSLNALKNSSLRRLQLLFLSQKSTANHLNLLKRSQKSQLKYAQLLRLQ
jgi:hypothetical protein